MHVAASQVQRPGYIVKRRHQHAVGVQRAQRHADTAKLRSRSLTGIFEGVYFNFGSRNRRPIGPDYGQRVEVCAHGDTALTAQVGYQCLNIGSRVHHTVDANLGSVHITKHVA